MIDCDPPKGTDEWGTGSTSTWDDESVMVGEDINELCAAETKGTGDGVKFDGENAMVALLPRTEVLWEIFS